MTPPGITSPNTSSGSILATVLKCSLVTRAEALVAYLHGGRPRAGCRKVFLRLNAPAEGLTVAAVTAVVYRACARAGLPRAGAHRLRHSAASAMLAGGGTLTEVGQVLRHARLHTTAIYAKIDQAALRSLARPWPGGAA